MRFWHVVKAYVALVVEPKGSHDRLPHMITENTLHQNAIGDHKRGREATQDLEAAICSASGEMRTSHSLNRLPW